MDETLRLCVSATPRFAGLFHFSLAKTPRAPRSKKLSLCLNFPFDEIQEWTYRVTTGDQIVDEPYLIRKNNSPHGLQLYPVIVSSCQ